MTSLTAGVFLLSDRHRELVRLTDQVIDAATTSKRLSDETFSVVRKSRNCFDLLTRPSPRRESRYTMTSGGQDLKALTTPDVTKPNANSELVRSTYYRSNQCWY